MEGKSNTPEGSHKQTRQYTRSDNRKQKEMEDGIR